MKQKDEIIKLGIDVHGVADTFPDFFSKVSRELVSQGHEVHIITGAEHTRALELYLKDQLGLSWTHLFSVTTYHKKEGTEVTYIDGNPYMDNRIWSRSKAEYCRRNGIELHIDDSDIYGKYFSTPYARLMDGMPHDEALPPLAKGGEWHATQAGSDPSIYNVKTTCPLPTVSVEMVIAAFSQGEIKVLLPPKPGKPDFRALPFLPFTPSDGGALEACATHILEAMTGLKNTWMEQLKTYDGARHLVTSYFALVSENAMAHQADAWFSLREITHTEKPSMSPFHQALLRDFYDRIKGKISYTPIAFALLENRFTWTELRCIYEAVLEKPIDPANFRKMIRTHYTIRSLKEKKVKSTAGRPPELLTYEGIRDVY
ncbi:hypothetical protein [Desulfoluna sp.]|uniref:NUDIX hydrolase n=1 Tax=Desulfoluna sp. TaxID=2045199 RepID=UPI00262C3D11|nr:hypothetical protein [Desulfoluna sp.]